MIAHLDCRNVEELVCDYAENSLPVVQHGPLEAHLRTCARCRNEVEQIRKVRGLLANSLGGVEVGADFAAKTGERLKVVSARLPRSEEEEEAVPAAPEGFFVSLGDRFGAAPWWIVSTALHALVILLIGLVTMAVQRPELDAALVTVTSLDRKLEAKAEPPKPAARDVLNSTHDTPATDPDSTLASNIVVPPDILAKAELGDHFETINPDRPDTQSAFGNPDARMFHSVSGNDEPEGGGGMGGSSLSEELIGVGGSNSPGSGGGWGGGNGTGVGIGNGSGKGSFGSRSGGGRRLMVMRHGGSKATESAVDKSLEWLARHQEADGRWDTKKHEAHSQVDTACTGLALLAFLGAGHTEKIGKYKDNVSRAVKWLIAQQHADGKVQAGNDPAALGYSHSIAGLALAEAAGMGRIPETKEAAQKAVNFSVEVMQQGEASDKLGWRYGPKEMGDTSVSGWFTMQLKSAKVAGLSVDPAAFEGASRFLDTVMVEAPKPGDPYSGHKYGYRRDGNPIRVKSTHCNTSIGCLMRQFLGVKPDELTGGVEYFLKEGGVPRADHPEFYHWYYATLCTFQQGGDVWKRWNEALKGTLLSLQRKDGDADGSWDPKGFSVEGAERWGGRVFTTAMGALCLEVYYRYLPMYR